MHGYDQDSETSASEVKSRPRRHRQKRGPQNSHDYLQQPIDPESTISNEAALSNNAALSKSKTSVDKVSTGVADKSEKRSNYANRRLTKMSNTSEEVDSTERRRPRRKVKSAQRIARSVSEEVLALEGKHDQHDHSTTRKESNMRSGADRGYSKTDPDATNVDRRHRTREHRTRDHRKRRKPTKNTTYSSGDEENYQGDEEFSEIYPVDKEDVVQPSEVKQNANKVGATHAMPPLPSQQSDVVYIEKKGCQGFVKEHKSKLSKLPERNMQSVDERTDYTTLDFVLKMHLGFRTISFIAQGLLAGIALSQCIFVYSLANQNSSALLQNYYELAVPYQSVYYFLLAISNVSIFDRYINISSGFSEVFSNLVRKPARALALISYLFALIFSVSLAQLDDRISMYKSMPSLWKNGTKSLSTWKIVNLLRVIGSVLGWIMVALAPNDDETAANIQEKINKEKGIELAPTNERNSVNSTIVLTLGSH